MSNFYRHTGLRINYGYYEKDPQKGFSLPLLKKIPTKSRGLCCYIDKNASKYDDPKFFNQIITNPIFNYAEKTIHVDSGALIVLVQKIGEAPNPPDINYSNSVRYKILM